MRKQAQNEARQEFERADAVRNAMRAALRGGHLQKIEHLYWRARQDSDVRVPTRDSS